KMSRVVAEPTRCANTPSGILRADSVAAIHCTRTANDRVTSLANVVLPTPESPNSAMPQKPLPGISADLIDLNSLSRKTTGHGCDATNSNNTQLPCCATAIHRYRKQPGQRPLRVPLKNRTRYNLVDPGQYLNQKYGRRRESRQDTVGMSALNGLNLLSALTD